MKDIKEIKPGTFIYEIRNAISAEDCESLIEIFESSVNYQYPGVTAHGHDPELKKATDISLHEGVEAGNKDIIRADNIIFKSLNEALNKLAELNGNVNRGFNVDFGYMMHRYDKDGHYAAWHSDEAPDQHNFRRLVALWYLNTLSVDQGGATEFLDQQLSVRPEQGKLILFPATWTHVHRGEVVTYGKKYISTTWIGLKI